MSERVSKFVVGAEAILLALPVTLLFLFWFPDELFRLAEYGGFVNRINAALAGSALVAGWWLMIVFWLRGSNGLQQASIALWVACGCGALAAVVVGALMWVMPSDEFSGLFGVLVFGLPLLIPFLHLQLERSLRRDANKPLKTDARKKCARGLG